jgi:hypothetical protein
VDCGGCIPNKGFLYYRDGDGDTFGAPAAVLAACSKPAGYTTDDTDCDDLRASIHPGAAEVCNGLDDDCDLTADEGSCPAGQVCNAQRPACEAIDAGRDGGADAGSDGGVDAGADGGALDGGDGDAGSAVDAGGQGGGGGDPGPPAGCGCDGAGAGSALLLSLAAALRRRGAAQQSQTASSTTPPSAG